MKLRDIPWNLVSDIRKQIRSAFFTREKPDLEQFVVKTSVNPLETTLRDGYNFEGAPYSYDYNGEIMNLRRPEGIDENGHYAELHIRGFRHEDGVEIYAHYEASRYEEKKKHLQAEYKSNEMGEMLSYEIINEAGFELEKL